MDADQIVNTLLSGLSDFDAERLANAIGNEQVEVATSSAGLTLTLTSRSANRTRGSTTLPWPAFLWGLAKHLEDPKNTESRDQVRKILTLLLL